MKPPNWERLQEIYHAALAVPPSERGAFLTNVCAGDADLLDKAKSLLNTGDSSDDFLKDPVFTCPPLADSLVGETIDGRYVVQRELTGGMSRVYVASDLQLPGKLVVIKVLPQTSIRDPNAVRRAKREIEALTAIDHPNVVSVFGAGEMPNGTPYVAMRFIDGVTLRSQILSNGMEVKRAASILQQIGAALGHIHNQGILHRDLKPENIMIQVLSDGTEVVKILDFGIAKLKNSVAATSTVNTVAIGTIAYMSPEQLRDGGKITVASDIYSMGIVACELITGRRPALASQEQRSVNEADLPPGVSKPVRTVLLRALSFEPENRYQSAKQFADDLAKALLVGEEKRSHVPRASRLLKKSLPLFGVLVLALLSYGIYKYVNRTTVPISANTFKYWIMVQQMRDGKEYQTPIKSHGGDETFNNGDRFQLNVSTTASGYVYIFNEGPPEPDVASLKMIYPSRKTNNGSASVGANQTIESDWITFRGPEGAENFWIVWSVSPISELEYARDQAFNHPQQGFTGEGLSNVKEYLKASKAKVDSRTRKSNEGKFVTVRGDTDVLVTLAQFKHR